MKQVLSGCSKTIAALAAILFVITALVVLLLFNVEYMLFRPDVYKDAMAEEGFYEQLPGLMAEQLRYGMAYNPCAEDPTVCEGDGQPPGEGEGGPPAFFENLTDEDWQRLLSGLIPPNWLREQTESVIDQLFAMLDTGASDAGILVDMRGLKAHMLGPQGVQAILGLIRAQPRCTDEQMLQLAQLEIDMSTVSQLLECSPPPEFVDGLIPEIRPILEEIVGGMKDEADLLASLKGEGEGEGEGASAGDREGGMNLETFQLVRLAIRLSPLLPLMLLLMVTLFGVRSLKGFLQWWGIPLLIVGLIALACSSLVPLLVDWGITAYGSTLLPGGISPELVGLVFDLVSFVLRSVAGLIALEAGVLAVVGFVFVIVSLFVRKRRKPEAVPTVQANSP